MFCNNDINNNITNKDREENFSCNIFIILFPIFLLLLSYFFITNFCKKRRIVYVNLNNDNINNENNSIENNTIENNQNNDNQSNNENNNLDLPPSYDSI